MGKLQQVRHQLSLSLTDDGVPCLALADGPRTSSWPQKPLLFIKDLIIGKRDESSVQRARGPPDSPYSTTV